MESEIAESNKITQYVVSIIVCAIIIALVLVPLSNIGGTTEVEQPGERMSLALLMGIVVAVRSRMD